MEERAAAVAHDLAPGRDGGRESALARGTQTQRAALAIEHRPTDDAIAAAQAQLEIGQLAPAARMATAQGEREARAARDGLVARLEGRRPDPVLKQSHGTDSCRVVVARRDQLGAETARGAVQAAQVGANVDPATVPGS